MKLINKLPKSYDELSLGKYIKIINKVLVERPDEMDVEDWNIRINLTILSILLDVPVAELEHLPAVEIIELIQSVQYLESPAEATKTSLELKALKEFDYIDYASYQKLRTNLWNNAPEILEMIVKNKSKEEIEQLNVLEVAGCFFTLNRSIKKSMITMLFTLSKQVMKNSLIQKMKKITKVF
jgi:hypothetical protein